jgi:hypothetical protein
MALTAFVVGLKVKLLLVPITNGVVRDVLALNVVNAPVLGVVLPMAPGTAHVPPCNAAESDAFIVPVPG